jgi:hypothetical protein
MALVHLPQGGARFLNAWRAVYADRGTGEPQASLTVYVYPSSSLAALTYRGTCPSGLTCKPESVKKTPDLKVEGVGYTRGNARCAFVAGTWSTLLMRVVTCASKPGYTSEKLKFDAGFLIGFVYGRAKSMTRQAPPPRSKCDPSYPSVCIPRPPPDLDCADVPYSDFAVRPPDPHGFDGDNDGVGCES